MMCDDCGIRPANIRLTTIINGEKTERNLCGECLAKNQRLKLDFSALAGHLSGLMDALKPDDAEGEKDLPEIQCIHCGMTYEQFRKTGMVGCAHCYDAFRDSLQALMERVHGHTQHVGRIPGSADSRLSLKLKIEKLREELNKAIEDEEYEAAASLRDQIRALQKKVTGEESADE